MHVRTWTAAAAVLLLAGGGSSAPVMSADPVRTPSVSLPSTVRVRTEGRVRRVPLEEYVLGSALSEVSPVDESDDVTRRIFEVQAVLARSYIVARMGRHGAQGFDVCDTTHCQLYEPDRIRTSRFAPVARAAVAATRGRLLTFGDAPAEALFHADCGGHTASADAVWGGPPRPYLAGATDALPPGTHRTWDFSREIEAVRGALNRDPGASVGRRLTSVAIASRDESGRARLIELRGERVRMLRGEDFRAVLNAAFGPRAIRSTRFAVEQDGRVLRFAGAGFGHGVGLCQVGAAARARRGDPLSGILTAYFPGARLTRAN